MFDQFKINGIRLKLTPLFQVATPSTFEASSRPSVAWAWDRTGEDINLNARPNDAYKHVCSYGSARSSSMAPGVSGNISTSIYATDLVERSVYFPTKSFSSAA